MTPAIRVLLVLLIAGLGFSRALVGSGFSPAALVGPGLTPASLVGPGFSPASLVGPGFSPASLVGPGFSRASLVASGFSRTPQASPQPRIPPVADREMTERQRAIVAAYVRPGHLTNDVRTLLRHPDVLPGVLPFWNYTAYESTLSAHDGAVLTLRTAWLSRSAYLWAKLAAGAKDLFTPTDLRRIEAAVPPAEDSLDVLLLRAADGLHRQSFVDEATWMALDARYSSEQLIDLIFTVGETMLLAGLVNSLGVPIDDEFSGRVATWALQGNLVRTHPKLQVPRIAPLEQTFWTGDLRALLDPDATGRPIAASDRTFARHSALYRPRQELAAYIRDKSTLPPRVRALAMLRMAALCASDYEWSTLVAAGRTAGLSVAEIRRIASTPLAAAPAITLVGWRGQDAAVLGAVDELFASDSLSEPAWAALSATLDRRQRIDLLVTVGGTRMAAMALNTLGVPLEPDGATIPR